MRATARLRSLARGDGAPADDAPADNSPTDLSLRQFRLVTLLLALFAGAVVFLVATEVFPYHSTNHDEGVYLQQAEMLLRGQLYLRPPVEGAMRPWFFVDAESPAGPAVALPEQAGDVLFSKYSPVPPAIFALGIAVGVPRLSLALVGAGIVGLTSLVTSEVFDRTTGVLAGVLMLASPMFLVDTATFLPYAPTALLNLAFAWAYLRADRLAATDRSRRYLGWALLSGLAIGAAFFSRPYTALLFALPFVAHACWSLVVAVRDGPLRPALLRQSLVTAGGLLGVTAALGYNWVVTGDPMVFPYLAFAPADGLGFGRRAILGYERDYHLALALEANLRVLDTLVWEWVVAGPLGTLVALLGLLSALGPTRRRLRPLASSGARTLVLAGLVLSIPLGNVAFWGNLNVLGDLTRTGDGLVALLGPYYHFDLLLPVAAFGAHGLLVAVGWLRATAHERFSPRSASRVLAAGLLVGTALFGGVGAVVVADPVAENAAVGDQLSVAYEPVVETEFDRAVVFLPTPYGDWLNHPFQTLRNDPDFGRETSDTGDAGDTANASETSHDDVVYALPERQFAVVDTYPDRTLYRYTYRGDWAPFLGDPVEPHLQEVTHARGERVVLDGTLGVPDGVERVSIRLSTDGESAYYAANDTTDDLPFSLVLTNGSVRLTGPVDGNESVPLAGRTDLKMTALVDFGAGQAFSYELTMPVRTAGSEVRALTPYVEVCRDGRLCGGESAYVPGSHTDGVFVETTLRDAD
jgi:hypothetical protein